MNSSHKPDRSNPADAHLQSIIICGVATIIAIFGLWFFR